MTDADMPQRTTPRVKRIRNTVNGEAVYGTVLVAGLVAGISHFADGAAELLGWTIATVAVFWISHVFAEVVSDDAADLRVSIRTALAHSSGMLWAVIPAAIIFLLSLLGAYSFDTAVTLEVWLAVALLAVIGYVAAVPRTPHLVTRLASGIGSGVLGLAIIVLKELVH